MSKEVVELNDELEECEIVTLVNDAGEEKDFLHIGTYEYEKEWYVFLQDKEEAEACAEHDNEECECAVYIYKLVGEDEDERLEPVEDDELAEKIYDAFIDYMSEGEEE